MGTKRLGLVAVTLLTVIAAVTAASAHANSASALNTAVEDAAPAIVMVLQETTGSLVDDASGRVHGPYDLVYDGTGFFISSNGYIITAAHVAAPSSLDIHTELADAYIDNRYNCDPATAPDNCDGVQSAHESAVISSTTVSGIQTTISVLTQNMSPADAGIPAHLVSSSSDAHLDVALLKIQGANEPILPLAASAQGSDGAPLAIIGYPAYSDRGPGGLTLQPTVTTGSVTGLLAPAPDRFNAPDARLVQTDATVDHGNSGGPGVLTNGQDVGVVSFGNLQSIDFLISVDDVHTVIGQTPINNAPGQIDKLWQAGLAAQSRGDTATAQADFQQCAALNPDQVYCADSLQGKPLPLIGFEGSPAPPGGTLASAPSPAQATGSQLLAILLMAVLVGFSMALVLLALRRARPQPVAANIGWWHQQWPPPPAPGYPPSAPPMANSGYPPPHSPPMWPGQSPPDPHTWAQPGWPPAPPVPPPGWGWPPPTMPQAWPPPPPGLPDASFPDAGQPYLPPSPPGYGPVQPPPYGPGVPPGSAPDTSGPSNPA